MRRWQALAVATTLVASPSMAQTNVPAPPDTAARREAMERLGFLVGEWAGEATYQAGRGNRQVLWQTEHVQWKLGGQVLLVEGLGRRVIDGEPADTAFNALATVDWNADRGYVMRSITLDGREGSFPLTVSDRGFVWGFEVPGGRVRYTMQLTDDGTWHERGEFTRDGQQWFPIMEMRLRRERP